jgi:8-oxo-dGTP pyrophosphatase MutT (NUDIX family)
MASMIDGRVHEVDGCTLRLDAGARWDFADQHAAAIAAHWERRRTANPALFNGRVLVCLSHSLASGQFSANLARTDFASFLYWRDHGEPDSSVRDVFGAALVHSSDQAFLLGRAGAHTINAGRYYLPAGFIDPSDIAADGSIDISSSIARELREEAGLGPPDVQQIAGYKLVFCAQMIAVVGQYKAAKTAAALSTDVSAFIARDPEPELDAVILAKSRADLAGLTLPDYMKVLSDHLFAPRA